MLNPKLIGLLTDFGEKGAHYVAAMKSIIFQINPDINLIDITHNIVPYSISEANFLIYYAYQNFPSNSIIISVVDPGVGTNRDLIAIKTKKDIILIGPNNGIFSLINSMDQIEQIFLINNEKIYKQKQDISYTFHGRDIMAPIAAKLSIGVPTDQVGPLFLRENLIISHNLKKFVFKNNDIFELNVLFIDSFGNIITNLHKNEFNQHIINPNHTIEMIKPLHLDISIAHTFADLQDNQLGFIEGSSDFMEICLKNNSASEKLNIKIGDQIKIQLK